MLYCHILLFKLTFYIDILSFYAGELSRNSQEKFTLKSAANAYRTLWITYQHLNNVFSLVILFITLAQFPSLIICCYHIVLGEKINFRSFGMHLTLLVIVNVALKTAACARTFEGSLAQAGQILASSLNLSTSKMENFRFQLMHQKLHFSVMKLYSFDNNHITKMSFRIKF